MRNVILLAAALNLSAIPLISSASNEIEFKAYMEPLNHSGVETQIEMKIINGNTLFVKIEATGLEPGKVHPQHIHGKDQPVKNATCPDFTADTDGDGLISVGEGLPSYGPIVLPLVPFDLVDSEGHLEYEATFTINPGNLQPLHKRTIVIHGMTVYGTYIPSLPVACGEIVRAD